uniref:IF-2 domain-containing protein n=1 Tax=Glossina austeni TaxID=7395 RepID=A0A1A9VHF1_GLOAU
MFERRSIQYSSIRIGPVVKRDVMKASTMLEHEPHMIAGFPVHSNDSLLLSMDKTFATILAFDVKVEREAQEMADSLGVKIFQADIIYHLFDKFMAYREELKLKKREEFRSIAVFPCKLTVLPLYVFNSRDPIVVGVMVENGIVKVGTPLCVPTKDPSRLIENFAQSVSFLRTLSSYERSKHKQNREREMKDSGLIIILGFTFSTMSTSSRIELSKYQVNKQAIF